MDRDQTTECALNVIESLRNSYTDEELFLITPRDIKEMVKDWGDNNTDIDRAVTEVSQWLKSFKAQTNIDRTTDDKSLSREERLELLRETIITVEKFEKEFIANNELYTDCDHRKFFNEVAEPILRDILSLSDNKKIRLLNALSNAGYNILTERGYYDFLLVFLIEIISLERYIFCEIKPREGALRLQNMALPIGKEPPSDEYTEQHIKRLTLYRDIIAKREKHSYQINRISDAWNMDYATFARLYRTIFGLSNTAARKPPQK